MTRLAIRRAIRRMTLLLGLLLAMCATACNSGPTEPSDSELIRLYTGRWRGNINGFDVALNLRTQKGRPADGGIIGLGGTGIATNPTTAEIHRFDIRGLALGNPSFGLFTVYETGPGGVILGGGKHTGDFDGYVPRDGLTWHGRWTSTTWADGVPIFGPGEYAITLTKE